MLHVVLTKIPLTGLLRRSVVTRVLLLTVACVVLVAGAILVAVQRTAEGVVNDQYNRDSMIAARMVRDELLVHGTPSLTDGKLTFGDWAVASDQTYLDKVAASNGMTGTILQADGDHLVRIVTTVVNPDGTRNVGTPVDGDVANAVLHGSEYYTVTTVGGVPRVGYYVPIKDAGGKVVGAVIQGAPTSSLAEVSQSVVSSVARVAIAGALIALLLVWLVLRPLRRGMRELTGIAQHLAEGDAEQTPRIHSQDELGRMADAFRAMLDYQREMAGAAAAIARGDLTADITPKSERDALGSAFSTMIGELRQLVGQVQLSAVQVASTSDQLETAASHTAAAVQQVTAGVQNVAPRTPAARPRRPTPRSSSSPRPSMASRVAPLSRPARSSAPAVARPKMAPHSKASSPAPSGWLRPRRRRAAWPSRAWPRSSRPSKAWPRSSVWSATWLAGSRSSASSARRSAKSWRRSMTLPSRPTCWP